MSRKTAGATLPLALVALAGCGSHQSRQTVTNTTKVASKTTVTSAPVDPCGVLTGAEVAAATGDKVASTKVIDHDCHYLTASDQDDGTVVSVYRTGGKEQMGDLRQSFKLLGGLGDAAATQGDVGKDVKSAITPPAAGAAPALGDEVLWGPNDMLAVRKGDMFVKIDPPVAHTPGHPGGMLASDADKKAVAQKLAEAVLSKLR